MLAPSGPRLNGFVASMQARNDRNDASKMDTTTDPSDDENFNFSNIKVTVGIDADLQMILEMDPTIVDLGVDVIGCTPAAITQSPCITPKTLGLPPITGGYVCCLSSMEGACRCFDDIMFPLKNPIPPKVGAHVFVSSFVCMRVCVSVICVTHMKQIDNEAVVGWRSKQFLSREPKSKINASFKLAVECFSVWGISVLKIQNNVFEKCLAYSIVNKSDQTAT